MGNNLWKCYAKESLEWKEALRNLKYIKEFDVINN